jgi:hypothetical protein
MDQENDVFTNQKQVIKNLRQAAETLGVNPDAVAPEFEDKQVLVAKKNCNFCYGRGALTVAGHDSQKRNDKNNKFSIASNTPNQNTIPRDTRKPEPTEKVKTIRYCGCVKPVVIKVPKQTVSE